MDIAHQFQVTSAELVSVQRELSQLFRAATDPVVEAQTSARRGELLHRRDILLDQWARLGLAWLLQGGTVALGLPAAPAAAAPSAGQSSPGSSADRSETPSTGADIGGGSEESARPAAEEAAPAPVTAVTVSAAPLERLGDTSAMDRGFAPAWSRAPTPRPPVPVDIERLKEILRSMEPPPGAMDDEASVREELRRLGENTGPSGLTSWLDFPKDIQRALVGMCVARARHIQDEISPALHPFTIEQELDRFFSGMTAFSKREQPGFVFGLRRHHHPVAEFWAEDAQRWWAELASRIPEPIVPNPERALDALRETVEAEGDEEAIVQRALEVLDAGVLPEDQRFVRLMTPHQEKLRKHTRFKRLRKAIRDLQAEDESVEAESASETSPVPADWPYWDYVRGRRAAIVGGDLREDARKRLLDAFEFASLDWVTTDHGRNVQNLANAVRGGSVELVIVLRRFIGHAVDRSILPVARQAGIPWVSVERGYGTTQVRLAMERFLAEATGDDT